MNQPYTFQQLFAEQLNDLISAEEQIAAVMPTVIPVTSSGELREAFDLYAKEVQHHIELLHQIFSELRIAPSGEKCTAVQGMIEEEGGIIHHGGNSAVKDAALIAAVQRLQHYKMALYGTARTFARHLEYNKAMGALQRSLNEETEMDRKLTRLAEGGIFTTGINEEACRCKP